MPKNISKIFLIFFFLVILFFPLAKVDALGVGDCCNDDSECDSQLICTVYSGCSETRGKQCMPGTCAADDPCPDGRTCLISEGRCARNDESITGCTNDSHCAGRPDRKFFCIGGECMACRTDSNCPERQRCDAGVCRRIEAPSPCHPSRGGCSRETDCADPSTICAYSDSERCFACLRRHCGEGEVVGNPRYCPDGRTCSETSEGSFCQQNPAAPPYFPESVSTPAAGQACDEYIECSDYGLTCKGDPPTCQPCSDSSECRGEPCGEGRCGASGYEAFTQCDPALPIGAQGCPTGEKCFVHGSMTPTCQVPNYCIDDSDCQPSTIDFEYKCENNECKTYRVSPTTPTPPSTETPGSYIYEVTIPVLQIPIPGFASFTPGIIIGEVGGNLWLILPWIGEYIAAIYKYTVGITGILAGIMIVIGGLIWLTAGGSAERVSTARNFIESAMVGLVIALTSYLLLYAINPKLTEFESLKIKLIEREGMEIRQGAAATTTTTVQGRTGEQTEGEIAPSGPASCTIIFFTDSQGQPSCFSSVVGAMLGEPGVNIVLSGGDMADANNLWSAWWDRPAEPLLAKWPVYPVSGNHDYDTTHDQPSLPSNPEQYKRRFIGQGPGKIPAPQAKVSCGNTDFFLLPWRDINLAQLKQDIAESTAKWKVVTTHKPFYSCNSSGSLRGRETREAIEGVQLVLAGHEHTFCDGEKAGIRYINSGPAGDKFRCCKNPTFSNCDDAPNLSYLRIEFGNSINVQRKIAPRSQNCRPYYPPSENQCPSARNCTFCSGRR